MNWKPLDFQLGTISVKVRVLVLSSECTSQFSPSIIVIYLFFAKLDSRVVKLDLRMIQRASSALVLLYDESHDGFTSLFCDKKCRL